ncbi:unnamed protein product [Caenorhabditis nigoni]
MAGTWAYALTPILQVSMSCNRFYVLYFPFGIKPVKKLPMTYFAIVFGVIVVSVLGIFSFPKGCGYVFDPEYFQWIPEDDVCAESINKIVMFAIFSITVISNSFNVATAARLVMSKMVGMTKQDSSRRRKRWMIMFVQSVLQDCLHIVDIMNATYIYDLSDEPWFQFLFLTLSFILIYTLDGFIMLVFNQHFLPKWCRKSSNGTKTSVMVVTSRVSVSTMS